MQPNLHINFVMMLCSILTEMLSAFTPRIIYRNTCTSLAWRNVYWSLHNMLCTFNASHASCIGLALCQILAYIILRLANLGLHGCCITQKTTHTSCCLQITYLYHCSFFGKFPTCRNEQWQSSIWLVNSEGVLGACATMWCVWQCFSALQIE